METYNQIHFSQISEILMQAAIGVSAVCRSKLIVSDMVYSLSSLGGQVHLWNQGEKRPFYIAIREMGTESGYKDECFERCKTLGYPLIIAKIERDKMCDLNMTIMFTHGWNAGDNNRMKQEFDSL